MSRIRFNTLIGSMLLLVVTCTGCGAILGPALIGSGVPASETRTVAPFSGVRISGALKANITIGENQTVRIDGDDNVVPLVMTEVQNGILRIQLDHNRVSTKTNLVTTIVTPQLSQVRISGAAHIVADGVDADSFDAKLSGASGFTISGRCQKLTADMSGASSLKAENLITERAEIEASGASNAKVNVSQALSAKASGASSIRYSGSPANVTENDSGASTIKPF